MNWEHPMMHWIWAHQQQTIVADACLASAAAKEYLDASHRPREKPKLLQLGPVLEQAT